MRHPLAMLAIITALSFVGTAGLTQEAEVPAEAGPDEVPLEVLPAVNPVELQQLANLSDSDLLARLFERAGPRQAPGLERFYPSSTQVFPISHGFIGPREACLTERSPVACHIHVQDLQKKNANRRAPPGLMNNPFPRAR